LNRLKPKATSNKGNVIPQMIAVAMLALGQLIPA